MSFIRKRLTYANVAMTVVLVFAMSGGAYAASKYLITSTKQISPKVLKALAGKTGPRGLQGLAGAQGSPGPEGKTGAQGIPGAQGNQGSNGNNGAAGATGPKGPAGASVTGPTGPTGPKGATGSPWPAGGTLPSGATETGSWGVVRPEEAKAQGQGINFAYAPISFAIPLAAELGESNVHLIAPAGKGGGAGTGCPTTSSVSKPEAEPGNLCVFEGPDERNVEEIEIVNPMNDEEKKAGTTGAILHIAPQESEVVNPIVAWGTWAVAGEA